MFSFGVLAEETDNFNLIKRGDHISITINNGNSFFGIVKFKIDDFIILDISYYDNNLQGVIIFDKVEIKLIKNVMPLSEQQKREFLLDKMKRLSQYKREAKKYKPANDAPIKKKVMGTMAAQRKEALPRQGLTSLLLLPALRSPRSVSIVD